MNIHPPKSIIVLLVGMASAAQIAPSMVTSQSQQAPTTMSVPAAPAATVPAQTQTSSQVQTTPPTPSTPIAQQA